MPIAPTTPLGRALARAVTQLRDRIRASDPNGSELPPIAIITPSEANGGFARQQLALADAFIRVEFLTPERLVHALAEARLARLGLRAEPSAWRSATVGELLRRLADAGDLEREVEALAQPGWTRALARAIATLETAGVDPDALAQLDAPAHAARLRVLASLLRGVARQREVDRLYSSADSTAAALAGVDASPWQGAVVLGDRLLAPQVHAVMQAWFARYPHVEVCTKPWHNLEPAPSGLRASLRSRESIEVRLAENSALAELAEGLFAGSSTTGSGEAIAADDSLVLASTPDEVRELDEATRVVLAAIREGTALDRIAVVLPDAEQVVALRERFASLGLPATWQVGPPLATTPAARFLSACLELAVGEDTVPAWYELLRQPGLRLGAAITADVSEGRGRWRRILARCGAVRSTAVIVEAIEAWAAALDEDDEDDREREELELERRSARNLVRALTALDAALHHLRRPATLGAHARRWSAFLLRWWAPSPDRAQVRELLRGWGSEGIGPSLPLAAAIAELRPSLEERPAAHGRLSDPAIRVLTPMGLLGGAFEVVVATGLREGRLPRRPAEDPVLPDSLIATLNRELGTRLLQSHELHDYELRRFAAVVGSCSERLWLSAPATELLEARPLLPSAFLLDVASTLTGARASYAALAALQRRAGSRARPWVEEPRRAVSGLEHRIASTAADPRAGLLRLANDETGRRLLGLQRALDSDAPTLWTGLLPGLEPAQVPGLDGATLDPRALAKLVANPGAYLADEVLGIRRPARLHGRSDPLAPWVQERLLLDALGEALNGEGPVAPAFEAAWEAGVDRWRRYRSDVDDEVIELLRAIARQRLAKLERVGVLPRGVRELVTGPPVPGAPWVIETQLGWREADELVAVRVNKPARGQLARDAPELVLSAMLRPGIARLRVVTLDARVEQGNAAGEAALLGQRLVRTTFKIMQGRWPWADGEAHPLRLSGERDLGFRSGEDVRPPARRPA